MNIRATFAGLLLAACALPVVAATPAASAAGPVSRNASVSPVETVLHDQHGKRIDKQEFEAALRNGQRYVSAYHADPPRFDLKLLPPGVATPGSFAPSDMAGMKFIWMNVGGRRYVVQFHDTHGTQIGLATFVAGAPAHQRYTTRLDKDTGTAVLTLLPAGVDEPGSRPTADWLASAHESAADTR